MQNDPTTNLPRLRAARPVARHKRLVRTRPPKVDTTHDEVAAACCCPSSDTAFGALQHPAEAVSTWMKPILLLLSRDTTSIQLWIIIIIDERTCHNDETALAATAPAADGTCFGDSRLKRQLRTNMHRKNLRLRQRVVVRRESRSVQNSKRREDKCFAVTVPVDRSGDKRLKSPYSRMSTAIFQRWTE
jgi:hypothetical protein